MTPLRQRSIDDRQRRHDAPKTPPLSGEGVSLLARHVKRSPERLGPEHLRAYQRALVHAQQRSWRRFQQSVCARRLRDRITLGQDWRITPIPCPRAEQTLPMGLSPPAVAQCLAASPQLT
jgi:hypothetical protein